MYFLRGRHDPIWSREERENFYGSMYDQRSKHARAIRFLELLKTVDGLFLQRFISFPEEVWSWSKYDLFVLQGISILITDEFLDGTIPKRVIDQKTAYSDLKSARKAFKRIIHMDDPANHIEEMDTTPRWVQWYLKKTWRLAANLQGFQRLFVAGLLSQTRGSGTPPPLVVLQSKVKFLKSVSEEPPLLSKTELALMSRAVDTAMGKIPKGVFTGLATKARVTVTGSACWEETRKDGGTAQAVLNIMSKYTDERIPVRDLDTGQVTLWKRVEDFESIGTAIFFACLQEVLETDPNTLSSAYLTLVKEPGKARSVTKGMAALKIVLDTISKICSYPLKKGFKSSESGMGRSHHGWNFFKDMCSEEMFEELFHEDRSRRVEIEYADYLERHIVWEDIFAGSTDYQEATDRMVHQMAALLADKWMKKCGIPPLLQGILHAVCYRPRRIYFTGTGVLAEIGTPVDSEGLRMITLKRGVLMGDPLTKVVLHLTNIVIREISSTLTSGEIFTHFSNGAECEKAYQDIILAALR